MIWAERVSSDYTPAGPLLGNSTPCPYCQTVHHCNLHGRLGCDQPNHYERFSCPGRQDRQHRFSSGEAEFNFPLTGTPADDFFRANVRGDYQSFDDSVDLPKLIPVGGDFMEPVLPGDRIYISVHTPEARSQDFAAAGMHEDRPTVRMPVPSNVPPDSRPKICWGTPEVEGGRRVNFQGETNLHLDEDIRRRRYLTVFLQMRSAVYQVLWLKTQDIAGKIAAAAQALTDKLLKA